MRTLSVECIQNTPDDILFSSSVFSRRYCTNASAGIQTNPRGELGPVNHHKSMVVFDCLSELRVEGKGAISQIPPLHLLIALRGVKSKGHGGTVCLTTIEPSTASAMKFRRPTGAKSLLIYPAISTWQWAPSTRTCYRSAPDFLSPRNIRETYSESVTSWALRNGTSRKYLIRNILKGFSPVSCEFILPCSP